MSLLRSNSSLNFIYGNNALLKKKKKQSNFPLFIFLVFTLQNFHVFPPTYSYYFFSILEKIKVEKIICQCILIYLISVGLISITRLTKTRS